MNLKQVLYELGITPALLGYRYILVACDAIQRDPAILTRITKGLYPLVARQYGVSPLSVEAAIRRAVLTAWTSNRVKLEKIVRHRLPEPPTTGHFLGQLTFYLNLRAANADEAR